MTAGQPVTADGIDVHLAASHARATPTTRSPTGQQVTVNAPAGTQSARVPWLGHRRPEPGARDAALLRRQHRAVLARPDRDWTLNAGTSSRPSATRSRPPRPTATAPAAPAGANCRHRLFSAALPVDPARRSASVTLPSGATPGPAAHLRDRHVGPAAMSGAVADVRQPGDRRTPAQQVTITGSGFGATPGRGYVAFSDNGTNWGAPGNTATCPDRQLERHGDHVHRAHAERDGRRVARVAGHGRLGDGRRTARRRLRTAPSLDDHADGQPGRLLRQHRDLVQTTTRRAGQLRRRRLQLFGQPRWPARA